MPQRTHEFGFKKARNSWLTFDLIRHRVIFFFFFFFHLIQKVPRKGKLDIQIPYLPCVLWQWILTLLWLKGHRQRYLASVTLMDFSKWNYFPFQQDTVVPRWSVICEALSKEIKSVEDLEKAVLEYNSRYASRWKFRGLHILLEQVCYDIFK